VARLDVVAAGVMGHPARDNDVSQPRHTGNGWTTAAAGTLAVNLVQYILLVTDGTVTNVLEAYAGEQIAVVKLRQTASPATDNVSDLEVRDSDEVMRREVLLTGSESGRRFVYAVTHFVPNRLDPAVRRGLLESLKPIGRLFDENHVETYREILTAWQEPAAERGSYFGIGRADPMLSRTYRIIARGKPVMLITEKFPADAFGD
jgi:chorismate-pyruvate lyase